MVKEELRLVVQLSPGDTSLSARASTWPELLETLKGLRNDLDEAIEEVQGKVNDQ